MGDIYTGEGMIIEHTMRRKNGLESCLQSFSAVFFCHMIGKHTRYLSSTHQNVGFIKGARLATGLNTTIFHISSADVLRFGK